MMSYHKLLNDIPLSNDNYRGNGPGVLNVLFSNFPASSSPQPPPFYIEYQGVPTVFNVETDFNGEVTFHEPNINFHLGFNSREERDDVFNLRIKVKATKQSERDATIFQLQKHRNWRPIQDNKIFVEINLDSCKKNISGGNVFDLSRWDKYHLNISVLYPGGLEATQNTNAFTLQKTMKRKVQMPDTLPPGLLSANSPILHSANSPGIHFANSPGMQSTNSPTLHSANSPGSSSIQSNTSFSSARSMKERIEANNVVADEIKTQSLQVEDQFYGQLITTTNGDIGYHFHLADQEMTFEEGEVVGFVGGKGECQTIEKLNYKNCEKVKLKGVITRSHYFEANKPKSSDKKTEIICMLGSVPVQVVGSVRYNEYLYASPEHPGLAISGHHLNIFEEKKLAYVGVAVSSRKTDDESSFGIVQAFVSLMEGASQELVNTKLRSMEESFTERIDKMKKKSKSWRKRYILLSLAAFIFLALLGFFLWQIYFPGSAYRYWRCKRGRKSPHTYAHFTYTPDSNPTSNQK